MSKFRETAVGARWAIKRADGMWWCGSNWGPKRERWTHVSFRIIANAFDGLLSETLTVKLVRLSPAADMKVAQTGRLVGIIELIENGWLKIMPVDDDAPFDARWLRGLNGQRVELRMKVFDDEC